MRVPRSERPHLSELVAARRQQIDQVEILKAGRPPRRQRGAGVGTTVTVSFCVTRSVDAILDRWAKQRNASRSEIVRQAILKADCAWERELARARG